MSGNSRRRGAIRKSGTKKGPVVGSGGQRRRGLRGKGPTPPAEERTGHPARRKAVAAARAADSKAVAARRRQDGDQSETVVGRNPVLECLRAGVPATGLHVAIGTDADDRLTEAVQLAADAAIPIMEVPRTELDRTTSGALHQGIALSVPPFEYATLDDLLADAADSGGPALLVALDGVTDPRNLGAVIRSAAAFGAHGVLLPTRRSASVTAVAWRTSAGAAARIPVARVTNLTRALRECVTAGLTVLGLDGGDDQPGGSLDQLDDAADPLLLVVGAEGRGLSRLVRENCDRTLGIPIGPAVESLNVSVAAGIALAEVARLRRVAGTTW